jgi:succinyl-diaminopimelate desuccinylase
MIRRDEIEAILSSLVSINTSNPPGNEAALALFIRDFLCGQGAREEDFHLIQHSEERASMVFCLPGTNPTITLGFAGHLDTVPPGNIDGWRNDPFTPVQREGFVYGRGTADMKGGLTAMIGLCLRYIREGPPPVNLRFFFTADEEASGLGIQAVREAGWFETASFLVVCEPTDGHPGLCEKGIGWYDFKIRGKTSHASMPEAGVNALELGHEYLKAVSREIAALAEESPLLGRNTCSVTQCSAGVKINVIPDRADFSVDIRLVPQPGAGQEQVETILRAAAAGYERNYPGLFINWECRDRRPALESDAGHPAVAWLIRSCAEDAGKQPVGIYYFTDASLVIPHYGTLPFIIMGPGKSAECHCPNEKIAPESIEELIVRYYCFAEALRPEWFT